MTYRQPGPAGRGDRGSVTLELAILGPALLLLIFVVVQAGLWFYARSLALAAAQEGVNAARGYQASADAGVARAQAFLAHSAGDSLQAGAVSAVDSPPGTVSIQVTGRALSILPGVAGLPVTQRAQAPLERFTIPVAP